MEHNQIQTTEIESLTLVEVLEQFVEEYRDILGDTRCSFLKEQATTYAAKMEEEYYEVEFIKKSDLSDVEYFNKVCEHIINS